LYVCKKEKISINLRTIGNFAQLNLLTTKAQIFICKKHLAPNATIAKSTWQQMQLLPKALGTKCNYCQKHLATNATITKSA
jgi:hypothetical protein